MDGELERDRKCVHACAVVLICNAMQYAGACAFSSVYGRVLWPSPFAFCFNLIGL